MRIRRATRHLLMITVTVALGGFLRATLVRLAPAFPVDEGKLDPRLAKQSVLSCGSDVPYNSRGANSGNRGVSTRPSHRAEYSSPAYHITQS